LSDKIWQLDAQYFQTINYEWSSLKSKVVRELNLNKDWIDEISIKCKKLVLYEQGSLFRTYNETEEKSSDLFVLGKLIIILPSLYSGGEHYIHRSYEKHLFNFAHDAVQYTHYIVYNSSDDCKHVIEPLTKGYQLTLVYNISVKKIRSSVIYLNPDSSNEILVQKIGRILLTWCKNHKNFPSKLVIQLSGEYTRDNMPPLLSNQKDRLIASLIFKSIEQQFKTSEKNNFLLYFGGLATVKEFERFTDDYLNYTIKILYLRPMFIMHNKDFPWPELFNFNETLDINVSFDELMDEEIFLEQDMPDTTSRHNEETGKIFLFALLKRMQYAVNKKHRVQSLKRFANVF
ncbi:unnamed protein product, partial [Didymodactylos carnosus]